MLYTYNNFTDLSTFSTPILTLFGAKKLKMLNYERIGTNNLITFRGIGVKKFENIE